MILVKVAISVYTFPQVKLKTVETPIENNLDEVNNVLDGLGTGAKSLFETLGCVLDF